MSGVYRFTVGDVDLAIVHDGAPVMPRSWTDIFHAPPDDVLGELRAHHLPSSFGMQMSPVLIRTPGAHLLIDTGMGGSGPGTGQLMDSLHAAGVSPGEIDLIVITHLHGDHTGGLLRDGQPAFSNARLLVPRLEYDAASPGARAAIDRWGELERDVAFVEDQAELAPGVHLFPAPGHTPGQVGVQVSSNGSTFMHLADAAHHPVLSLRHPEWETHADANPERAAQTRRALLERAAQGGALVAAYHFPWPGLGHVLRGGAAYRFQPVFWDWSKQ